jgi:1,4-alpha-glucan branching enzyme
MKTSTKSPKTPTVLISAEQMQAIYDHKGDPFAVLGLHPWNTKNQKVCRAYFPNAKTVQLIDPEGSETYPLVRQGMTDFFCGPVPESISSSVFEVLENTGHSFRVNDPYSHNPVLTDFELHLIAQGTHYELWNTLGANLREHEGVEGVLFAVWAPNARGVSVVGDFNAWDGRRHPMRPRGTAGVWELFVPGLHNGDLYKFEVFNAHGDMRPKMDPMAKASEVRPGTASRICDIKTFQWQDREWLQTQAAAHPVETPMSIYEVHLGSWRRPWDGREFHTYSELAEQLIPYVKEMGFTHIELMPILEHPLDESWGYQVTGYYSTTSRYGSPLEFKAFVDACHQAGIGIILDWVPAHFPKDGQGLSRFDGTGTYEHEDPRQGEHPHWGTLIFNFGRNEVENFLIASALYWLEEFHLDGLRVDAVASMLYLDYGKDHGQWVPNQYGNNINLDAIEFMKHLNSIIRHRAPHARVYAEESTSFANITKLPEDHGLGFHYKWNMGWMNDILRYFSKEPIFRRFHQNDLTFGLLYAFTENFVLVLSHDEVVHGKGSMIGKMPGDEWQRFANLRSLYAFMWGHPGKKLLFMGCELAQYREWNAKGELDWNLLEFPKHQGIQSLVKDLNHLYTSESALWQMDHHWEGFEWISCEDADASILAFARRDRDGNEILVVCNFTPVPREGYCLGCHQPASYTTVLNSDSEFYGGSNFGSAAVQSQNTPYGRFAHSFAIDIPPLGVLFLKKNG